MIVQSILHSACARPLKLGAREPLPDETNKNPRTHRRKRAQEGNATGNSGQALLQHMRRSTYGCFLPDLTGFGSVPLSRTQPSTFLSCAPTEGHSTLGWEFNLAKADCEYRTPLVSRLARAKNNTTNSNPEM